jgi:glycosyltransferase involved in cell wall biosynthesis
VTGGADRGETAGRVTIVAHDVARLGGMERQLSELVTGLLGRGWSVTVISRTCELPAHPRLRWVRVPCPRRPFVLAYAWFAVLGSLLVWRHRTGVVHTTGALVANRVDLATVHLCHAGFAATTDILRARSPALHYRLHARLAAVMSRAAERRCYRPAVTRRLVAVSGGLADEIRLHLHGLGATVSVVPNGVDTTRFRPDPEARRRVRQRLRLRDDAFVAIFVGSEWEGKGLAVTVAAVAATAGAHLLVVGSGDTGRYQRIAERAGAAGRVLFLGSTPGTAELYAAADVFVLPSVYETFSMVTYEAAACGLPLLVTRVSGVEDVLTDEVNGWFITPEPRLIAERLRRLRDDAELRLRMGTRSRQAARPFAWSAMVDGYERVYRSLAPSSAPFGSGAEVAS